MSAERRWTISGAVMARDETGERYMHFPRIVPSLEQNESVEVMPVSEHEAAMLVTDEMVERMRIVIEAGATLYVGYVLSDEEARMLIRKGLVAALEGGS